MSVKKLMFLMLMVVAVIFAFACDSNATEDDPPAGAKYYVYGDGDGVTVDFDGTYYGGFDNTASSNEEATGGAGNSGKYQAITGAGGDWAAGGWQYDDVADGVDLSGYTTLKFSVKSAAATTMKVKLQSGTSASDEISVSDITNEWTEKSVPLTEFTTGALDNLSNVNVLFVFVLAATSDQIDLDEVYFVE